MNVKMKIRIKHVNRQKGTWGIFFVALGVAMPWILTVKEMGIYQDIFYAIATGREMKLVSAAIKLVALNSLRGFPHYLGAFFISEALELEAGMPLVKLFKSALVMVIIPPVYFLIARIHHIRYDFGLPALVVIVLLIIIGKKDYNYVSTWKKSMMIMVFLTAVQFLDIMPCLNFLPIGRGEVSQEIKAVSLYVGADAALNATGGLLLGLLTLMGLLLLLLIQDENNIRSLHEISDRAEKMEMQNKLWALENRNFLEINSLVHDLKSPLTSVQALVGVVHLSCLRDNKKKEAQYLEQVESSVEKMSGMISEILSDSYQSSVTCAEIINAVLAQISILDYAAVVQTRNDVPEKRICVNKIRLVRAIINLVENSIYAMEAEHPLIEIAVSAEQTEMGSTILIAVCDNAKGIPHEISNHIWGMGYSTRGSHGLGLSFVKDVVEKADGQIRVESEMGIGTMITIMLSEADENE